MTATLDNELADLRRANAELQRRLDEALAERDQGEAQQTATAEVLQVINSSPGDLAPVFDAMLRKALKLCGAAFGFLTLYEAEYYRTAAHRGVPPELAEFFAKPVISRQAKRSVSRSAQSIASAAKAFPQIRFFKNALQCRAGALQAAMAA